MFSLVKRYLKCKRSTLSEINKANFNNWWEDKIIRYVPLGVRQSVSGGDRTGYPITEIWTILDPKLDPRKI